MRADTGPSHDEMHFVAKIVQLEESRGTQTSFSKNVSQFSRSQ